MSGGTPVRARLSVRIGALLERQLPGCPVFSSDLFSSARSDETVWTSGDLQITVGDIYSGIIL